MKANALVLPAVAALALVGLASTGRAAAVPQSGPSNKITIPGTVVSSRQDQLVIRTDDHGHRMAFDVSASTALPDSVRRGAHVSVTYHPEGPTGQAADEVQVVERGAFVPSQAAFQIVTGGTGDVRVGAR
jgi:hypothetical protein